MRKKELVQLITNEVKEKGHKVSQPVIEDVLIALENVVDTVITNKDEVVIAGIKIHTKLQKGREGVINMGAKAGETYVTTDKIVPNAKFVPSKKNSLSVEV